MNDLDGFSQDAGAIEAVTDMVVLYTDSTPLGQLTNVPVNSSFSVVSNEVYRVYLSERTYISDVRYFAQDEYFPYLTAQSSIELVIGSKLQLVYNFSQSKFISY